MGCRAWESRLQGLRLFVPGGEGMWVDGLVLSGLFVMAMTIIALIEGLQFAGTSRSM